MHSVRARDFLPSRSGFHFPNAFRSQPTIEVHLPGGRSLGLGNAANGLCGGMAFAARDSREAGLAPPTDVSPPDADSPLFDYLVGRLRASFDLPLGLLRYLELMSP